MKQAKIPMKKLKCDNSRYNKIEVETWKKLFLQKNPIPSPCVNKNNEVMAFFSTYFVMKELNHKTMYVVKYTKEKLKRILAA